MNTEIVDRPDTNLSNQWQQLLNEEPKLRIRNAAQQLGVSELELLLTKLHDEVYLLTSDFVGLLKDLEQVGSVMALTRNEQVVHERHGVYTNFKANKAGNMGICLGDIDLRTFFSHWSVACAVAEKADEAARYQTRKSIQFFNTEGKAVHKVYLTVASDEKNWDTLVEKYKRTDQVIHFVPQIIPKTNYPNSGNVSAEAVQKPWSELKDVHHFQALLKKLGIDRLEALNLVGETYAKRLDSQCAERVLESSAEKKIEIMVFVGNGNIVQIHTGKVNKLLRTGPWFNVLDPDFNLHMNTEEIKEVWRVKRPSVDGIITSIECFNAQRELVVTFFGARKPGQVELESWQDLVAKLEQTA